MLRLLEGHPLGTWDTADVEHLVRVQRAVLGHRLEVLDHTDDLERDAAAFLDLVDRDHLAVLESGIDRARVRRPTATAEPARSRSPPATAPG